MRISTLFGCLSVMALATPARAQIELGIDASLTVSSWAEADDEIAVSVPTGVLRVAVGAATRTQLQLHAAFGKEGPDVAWLLAPGIVVSFREAYPTEGGLFLGVGPAVRYFSGDRYSETQFGGMVEAGWRIPLNDVSAVRLAATYGHWRATGAFYSSDVFGLAVGLSLFP